MTSNFSAKKFEDGFETLIKFRKKKKRKKKLFQWTKIFLIKRFWTESPF